MKLTMRLPIVLLFFVFGLSISAQEHYRVLLPDQPNVKEPIIPVRVDERQIGKSKNGGRSVGTWGLDNPYGSSCGANSHDCNASVSGANQYDNMPPSNDIAGLSCGTVTNTMSGVSFDTYSIPYAFTVIRECGTGNLPDSWSSTANMIADLEAQIDQINAYYACNDMPIQLSRCSTHGMSTETDNSTRVLTDATLCSFGGDIGAGTDNGYADGIDIPDVLNIYIAQEVNGSTGCNGFAFLPTSVGAPNRIVMQASCFNSFACPPPNACENPGRAQVLIHEIGHYLGLYHTHNPFELGSGQASDECPDGSNCCTTGDFICDTDADPNLSAGCVVYGDAFDCLDLDASGCTSPCGTPYPTLPSTHTNIMSYNSKPIISGNCADCCLSCQDEFSQCQKAKMIDALLCSRGLNLCCRDVNQEFAGGNGPNLEICLNDNAPTFTASSNCYNWYDALGSSANLLVEGSAEFTPDIGTGVGQLDNTQEGTYTWYLGDANEINPNCRTAVTVEVMDCSSCPALTAAPAALTVTNSTCMGPNCQVGGGEWSLASSPCPNGFSLMSFTSAAATSNGQPITVAPNYNTTTNETYHVRCVCDDDDTIFSPVQSITSMNGSCDTPTANAGNDEAICSGESVNLTATGGGNYAWSTGDITAMITVMPTATTNYTVTVTDTNGCIDTDEVEVTVNQLPTANAGNDEAICSGESVNLTATGGGNYAWNTGDITAMITVMPTATTTYTVTVTDTNGCTGSDEVEVTVNPIPTFTVSATNPTGCGLSDGAITLSGLTASATYTITYMGGVGSPVSGSNAIANVSGEIELTGLSSGTYTGITVADASGCISMPSSTILSDPNAPTANAGNDAVICAGESANLTATGGGSYAWSTGDITAMITVTPTATTNYTVTVTDTNGCTDTDEVEVTVNPLPTANAGNDVSICIGESTNLAATGGGNYAWSTGDITAMITVTPTATTTYTVTVTDTNGCTGSDEVEVTVNPIPTFTVSATNPTGCGLSDGAITLSGLTASATYTITYMGGVGSPVSGSNATANVSGEIELTGLSSGTYTGITVEDALGCISMPSSITLSDPNAPTANAGNDAVICAGESANLTATGGGSYAWSTGDITAMITVTPTATTNYTVTVTATNGCTDTDEVEVTVNPLPNANAGNDVSICTGESTNLTATGGGNYAWSTGDITAMIAVMPTATTTYTVTVTDTNGCTDTDEVEVTVNPLPTANAGNDLEICTGENANLTATGGGSYAWSTGDITAMIAVMPTATTTYTVTVTDANGCTDTDEVEVMVNPLPTANAGNDLEICTGENANLTATGGGNYAWSTGDITAMITVMPTATTTYTVTVSDANNCEATDQIEVTVNDYPTIDDVNVSCQSGTPNTGTITIIATLAGGTLEYSLDGNMYQSTNVFAGIADGNYTVYVRDVNAQCEVSQSNITIMCNCSMPATADAGSDLTYCGTNPVTLSATFTVATGGMWSGGAGTFADPTAANTTYTPTASEQGSTITLTWTTNDPDGTGLCVAVSDDIVLNQQLQITDVVVLPASCDMSDGQITITANGATNLEYSIDGGVTYTSSPVFTDLAPNQSYAIAVRDADNTNCELIGEIVNITEQCVFSVTDGFSVTDPCACLGDGLTFEETVTVVAPGTSGYSIRLVDDISNRVVGTSLYGMLPAPLVQSSTDPSAHQITFVHTARFGYSFALFEYSTDGGTTWNTVNNDMGNPISISNICAYPEIDFNLDNPYCPSDLPLTLNAQQTVNGYSGTFTYSGNGVTGDQFNPNPANPGEYTITATYQADADGIGSDGTTSIPAVPINATDPACQTQVESIVDLRLPNCGDLPWDGNE